MEIRRITQNDLLDFWQVFKEVMLTCFPEYPLKVRRFFVGEDFINTYLKKDIKDWDFTVWLAEENKKVIGFLVKEALYGGVSFADWLGVAPGYQRRGIGSALIRLWEEEVLKEKGHKLLLVAPADNRRDFYLKQGFEEEGLEKKSWYGVDHRIFGKQVSAPSPPVFLKGVTSQEFRKK